MVGHRRNGRRKFIIISRIQILRLYQADFHGDSHKHVTTQSGVMHFPVMGVERDDVRRQFIRRFEVERNVAFTIRTEERLEGQCICKALSYRDLLFI